MAMADAGIETKKSSISLDQFIKYRQIIEPTIPLSSDLLTARLGFLPRLQKRWRRVKDRIQNCLHVRTVEDMIDRDAGLSLAVSLSASVYLSDPNRTSGPQ
jgi:hypothetical protein